jgi:hypothetical protein
MRVESGVVNSKIQTVSFLAKRLLNYEWCCMDVREITHPTECSSKFFLRNSFAA